ncbi:3-keto-steroid reductase [Phaeosphaeria sp. MPI-PUGE-AT-0046c]|nr:3-keto-steroid reductase [Phaeosphaeria sp. MPI-PUGE-AT-0046c]
MSQAEDIPQPENGFYVLVTGANSGLGLGIANRLIAEFLQTRPQTESLVLIITTRDQRKGDATIEKLQQHLHHVCLQHEQTLPGISGVLRQRVHLRQERLDLLSLVSVQKLSKRLRETTPKLDAVICNAGIGGWTGINWPLAIFSVVTTWKRALTYPTFKISGVGCVAKPQILPSSQVDEPPLGEVFCANVFGHYLLGHYLGPLLARDRRCGDTRGRIIWVSSLEAYDFTFNIKDMQGLQSHVPYESSKRLTDVMAITSRLSPVADELDDYFETPKTSEDTLQPRIYVAHPGICGTSIVPLAFILEMAMFACFYLARFLGSQWHSISVEKGAVSMVWLALAKQSTLDNIEEQDGIGKWGSATDFWGQERVERTEVAGWGWGGRLGEYKRKGRNPYAKDLTKESAAKLLETGAECWTEMERLRVEWENRLQAAGVAVEMD